MIPAPALSTPLSLFFTHSSSLFLPLSAPLLSCNPPLLYDWLLICRQHHQRQLDCKSHRWVSRRAVICIRSPLVSTLFICLFRAFFPPAWSPALQIPPLIATSRHLLHSLLFPALVKKRGVCSGKDLKSTHAHPLSAWRRHPLEFYHRPFVE